MRIDRNHSSEHTAQPTFDRASGFSRIVRASSCPRFTNFVDVTSSVFADGEAPPCAGGISVADFDGDGEREEPNRTFA